MSTMNENKRPSADVTDDAEAESTKPQKKANQNHSLDEHLKEELLPYLEMASNDDVKNLAKSLFGEMWKTNGDKAAAAATAPFLKKVKKDRDTNHRIAGTWVSMTIDKKIRGHTLTIDEGIRNATFIAYDKSVKVESLILQSSEAADKLIYTDTTQDYRWWFVRERGTIQLELEYNSDQDTIQGVIEVLDGGSEWFIAKRKGASD